MTLLGLILLGLLALALWDITQDKHTILRNFPIIGHFRYWLEMVGPELRQYIVTNNDEERPFSRDQRSWVYASAKRQQNTFGFGTDNDLEFTANNIIIRHSAFPRTMNAAEHVRGSEPLYRLPCAKVLGAWRKREKAFRLPSVVNVSGMSYGSLSGPAIEALNRGCHFAEAHHNTGEGGISEFHKLGGRLIWQIGTGYFGARDEHGTFSMARLKAQVEANAVDAIEIKLSQGAKPGKGGLLPAAKVTPEIAAARGVPVGVACESPSGHAAFRNVDGLLDFVEAIAAETGLPVGIKSAVGDMGFWHELAQKMTAGTRGVDFITIDGGEGGTGAAPLVFSDHVSLPFKVGFAAVYKIFAAHNLQEKIVFIGSGRLGFPEEALLAMALGCDAINVGREAMMAIGCIQAQRCHTDHCPTGVATHNAWLTRGLVPHRKADRLANYLIVLRKEMLTVASACSLEHPAQMTLDHFTVVGDRYDETATAEVFRYTDPKVALPAPGDLATVLELMRETVATAKAG